MIGLSWAEAPQAPPTVDAWLAAHMPAVRAATAQAGHPNGPYVDLRDELDPTKGFSSWTGPPRFSSAYFPLRNRPSILVETLSYKPYRDRVLATRGFLLALLAEIGKDPAALVRAVEEAEARTVALGRPDAAPSEVVVRFEESEESVPVRFPVYAWSVAPSKVTGEPLLRFESGKVREIEVPWTHESKVALALPRPRGYLVLPGWPAIEGRLRAHGLRVEELTAPAELEVEAARLSGADFADFTYQGRTAVQFTTERAKEQRQVPAGALWVPADQPDFEVAVQLLEPDAPDSLARLGGAVERLRAQGVHRAAGARGLGRGAAPRPRGGRRLGGGAARRGLRQGPRRPLHLVVPPAPLLGSDARALPGLPRPPSAAARDCGDRDSERSGIASPLRPSSLPRCWTAAASGPTRVGRP